MEIRLTRSVLRPYRIDDAAELTEHANNWNVARRLRNLFPHPYTRADAEAWLAKTIATADSRLIFCIEVAGHPSGGIGLHPLNDVYHLTAELGYWLAEPLWGRGIVSEAVEALVRQGFASMPLERIEASTFSNNPASARVLEKCGFTFEGRLRRNVSKGGEILDSLVYSILREEVRA